jgi:hypothetical protein
MEFSIRVLVVIVLIVIAFVVFVALIGSWGGESGGIVKALSDWFRQIISGQAKPPSGTLPGTPATPTGGTGGAKP